MPRTKKPSGLSETQELKVLLEEIRSQQKLILERVESLPEQLERVEFRLGRVEQDTSGYHTARVSHSTEIQHEIAKLIERFELHQKEHAA